LHCFDTIQQSFGQTVGRTDARTMIKTREAFCYRPYKVTLCSERNGVAQLRKKHHDFYMKQTRVL